MSSTTTPTGLLYVPSVLHEDLLSKEQFNTWYAAHLKAVVNPTDAPLALRFENTDPSRPWPYLALVKLASVSYLHTDGWKNNDMCMHLLPGNKGVEHFSKALLKSYECIQRFEGQGMGAKEGSVGECIVTVAMEPAEGMEGEFEEWYRKQHLDMLSMVRGYRRSTRYKLTDDLPDADDSSSPRPRYLAIHEYDSTDLPADQLKLVVGTEWSKRIIGGARVFERDVWRLVEVVEAEEGVRL